MKDFLKYYCSPFEKDINLGLMTKSYDEDLVTYLVECMESLEILPNIKFDFYEFIDAEHLVDENSFTRTRKSNKKEKKYRYMSTVESRCGELRLYFTLTCEGKQAKIVKKILVPLQDDDGYFMLKGMRYMLLYQLLEASTFMTRNSVTLKSLQAVTLRRKTVMIKDITKQEHECPIFHNFIFNKPIVMLHFYLAKFGFNGTLAYFHCHNIIDVICIEEVPEEFQKILKKNGVIYDPEWSVDKQDPEFIYFARSKRILFRVRRKFFDKYVHVRAIIAMILEITTNRLTIENIFDRDFWLLKLDEANGKNRQKASSADPSAEKGYNTLIHFSRMMDKTTSRNLKLPNIHKKDAYAVVRWLMLEYDTLKKKDNMDMENKRLRCNEAISSRLTNDMSLKLSRAVNKGKKLKMADVKQIFKFPGDIIIKNMYASGILPFDDRTSDLDFFNKFNYTTKGSNALGNKNEQSISIKYRGLDPSDIGRKDINVCSNSDPGRSGMLTPFCKTHGLFFSDKMEPQERFDEFIDDLTDSMDRDIVVGFKDRSTNERNKAYEKFSESLDKLKFIELIESVEPDIGDKDEYEEIQ